MFHKLSAMLSGRGRLDREIPTSPSSLFLLTLPPRNLSCHSNPYQIKPLHEFSRIGENGHFQKCQTFSGDSDLGTKGLSLVKDAKLSRNFTKTFLYDGNSSALKGLSGPHLESDWNNYKKAGVGGSGGN